MELESIASTFYESVLQLELSEDIEPVFQKIHQRCLKRVKLLERVRRENVTEMILEPIEDFQSDSYVISESITDRDDTKKICETSSLVEGKRHAFFERASQKIEFLIEAAESFERFSEENQENSDHLSKAIR